ncbi:MAG: DEAD/DEAH box helicase [Pirellulaceae bacterium]
MQERLRYTPDHSSAGSKPETHSVDVRLTASVFATGWNAALARSPRISIQSSDVCSEPLRVVSLFVRQPLVKTRSYTFPELPSLAEPTPPPVATGAKPDRPKPSRRTTRLRPPNDIIKLADRLYYVLQPPLETMLARGSVQMPFEPFPYQYQGIGFLYPRFAAILADEMGLGKTMQAITAIRLLLRAGEVRSVLLVCPKPLVSNWRREFTMWAPEIPLCVLEGDRLKRRWQWYQAAPVRIANYELLMRDRDVLLGEEMHFDLVVLDEAQRIKNRSSTTSQIIRRISRSRSWALTGTPVENSADDLIGIFDFISPGCLSSGMTIRRMAKAAGEYILRRTKDMVLTDLPPKLYRDAELDLTPEQWESYRIAEDEGVVRLEGLGEEITIQHVFQLILRLKQICNFDPATRASSKLERLEADLGEIAASGQKAIVFSQWVGSLEIIRKRLQPYGPLEYHGRIPSKRRDGIINQFRDDPSKHVLLMSYGAGSVGLNLQFCGYVFLFDRWWNPAVEDQAINRAHRIGSAGPVTVSRMLTLGTIEEQINQVLDRKRELFATLITDGERAPHVSMTQDEIFGLFNLQTHHRPHPSAA